MLILYWIDAKTGAVKSTNFDAVSNETHESILNITMHPVEEGGDITDNARLEPRKLSVEGYVSNKPLLANLYANPLAVVADSGALRYASKKLDLPSKGDQASFAAERGETTSLAGKLAGFTPHALIGGATSALGSLIFGGPPDHATVLASDDPFPNRALNVYNLLIEAQKTAAFVRAITKFGVIESLLVAKVGLPRTVEDGNGATFQVELTQVRVVKSETVDAPVPTELRGATDVAKGVKATDTKNDDKLKKQYSSTLVNTGKGLGLLD